MENDCANLYDGRLCGLAFNAYGPGLADPTCAHQHNCKRCGEYQPKEKRYIDYVREQLNSPELKKDAEDCLKIYHKLMEIKDGDVRKMEWDMLVDVHYEGYPNTKRTYKPSKIGYVFLNGIEKK